MNMINADIVYRIIAIVVPLLMQFFIVKDSAVGREPDSKLIQKVRENIKVYFLYDDLVTHPNL